MLVTVRNVENACIVDVAGSVTIDSALKLKDAVLAAMETGPLGCVVNMKNVTILDSSGIGTLISLNARLARNGLAFRVANVPHTIMQVLELTQALSILPTEPTVLGALCAFGMAAKA